MAENNEKGLKKVMAGLGWDELVPLKETERVSAKQYFTGNMDFDAFAILLDGEGKLIGHRLSHHCVYYGNLKHKSGAVIHMGDNPTGSGEGDDEEIRADLEALPPEVCRLVFAVNIFDADKRGQHFGMAKNAYIRLVDMEDGKELCRYNLSEDYAGKTGFIMCEIYRDSGRWRFNPLGRALDDASRVSRVCSLFRQE